MRNRISGVFILLLIIVVIIASQALFTVDETKQAIILQFGEPIKTIQTPGLNAKLKMRTTRKAKKHMALRRSLVRASVFRSFQRMA